MALILPPETAIKNLARMEREAKFSLLHGGWKPGSPVHEYLKDRVTMLKHAFFAVGYGGGLGKTKNFMVQAHAQRLMARTYQSMEPA